MDYKTELTAAENAHAFAADAPDLALERYLPQVEGAFVSEEEALQFLTLFANMMRTFVDIGWGVDSIHFVLPELEQISMQEDA